MKRKPVTLSFRVVSVKKSIAPFTSVVVADTELSELGSGDRLFVRGEPWPTGAKVDFVELQKNNPRK